jgi:hypothetical protein
MGNPPVQQQQPPPEQPKSRSVKWTPAAPEDHFDVRLAEGSVQPMSQAALRSLALELKKVGAIDVLHLLLWCGVPDAEEIASAVENELKLAALAKVQRK